MRIRVLIFLLIGIIISKASAEEHIAETSDGRLFYKSFGAGETILIINGGPGLDCKGFEPLAKLLSDKYNAVIFDQRGTGKSTLKIADSNTVTLDKMIEDMETIRKDLKLKNWIVLGHSFGGWLAELYAVKYPGSIKALILSSTGGIDMSLLNYFNDNLQMRLSSAERDSLKLFGDKIAGGDTSYATRLNKMRFLASAYLYDKQFVPGLAKRMASGSFPLITDLVYKDLFKTGFDCKPLLGSFTKPVLIIQGRQDITGDGVAYEVQKVLRQSKIVFIDKSCHYSWLEQSDKYKACIDSFVSELDRE